MYRILVLCVVFVTTALPVAAGIREGMAAYHRGDYRTAFDEFQPLAEQGNAVAQYNLGLMYEKGYGVLLNAKEAVKWYRRAAKRNYPSAQHKLGYMYYLGSGVPQSHSEAINWYRKAAEQGHALAQYDLGAMYYFGQGVRQNYVMVHMWLSLAAAAGQKDAASDKLDIVEKLMTPAQIAKAKAMAAKWRRSRIKSTK